MQTKSLEIKVENLFPNLETLKELFEMQWNEVYGDTSPDPCDIWLEQYKTIENAGMSIGIFAYYEDVIVGYSVSMLAPNFHSRGKTVCANDALFVDPIFRDTSLGLRLLKATEEEAARRGANKMVWYAPVSTNLGKILMKKKYTYQEQVFSKELKCQ